MPISEISKSMTGRFVSEYSDSRRAQTDVFKGREVTASAVDTNTDKVTQHKHGDALYE